MSPVRPTGRSGACDTKSPLNDTVTDSGSSFTPVAISSCSAVIRHDRRRPRGSKVKQTAHRLKTFTLGCSGGTITCIYTILLSIPLPVAPSYPCPPLHDLPALLLFDECALVTRDLRRCAAPAIGSLYTTVVTAVKKNANISSMLLIMVNVFCPQTSRNFPSNATTEYSANDANDQCPVSSQQWYTILVFLVWADPRVACYPLHPVQEAHSSTRYVRGLSRGCLYAPFSSRLPSQQSNYFVMRRTQLQYFESK